MLKWKKISVLGLLAMVVLATGCSKQQYVKQTYQAAAASSGATTLPAQVDILIVPDNTGSITSAFNTIQGELTTFVSTLNSQGWDYHLARSYLANPGSINQILVNPAFNASTLPGGIPNPNTFIVPPQYAVTNVNDFVPLIQSIDTANGDQDYTYQNTYNNLVAAQQTPGLNFLRPGVPLAVIVVTNGADWTVSPLTGGNEGSNVNTTELQSWASKFISLKGASQLIQFYPVAAEQYYDGSYQSCLVPGGQAFVGWSYTEMVTNGYLPGQAFDFCNAASLPNIMSSIATDLQTVQESFQYSYVVLPQLPVESSITLSEVTPKGTISIPQSATNGWTYECTAANPCPRTVNTVTGIVAPNGTVTPFSAEPQTGWILQLHGSAIMTGQDQTILNYTRP